MPLSSSLDNYLSECFLQERSCVAIKDDLNYNPTSRRGRQFYNRSNDNFLGAALAVGGDGDVLTCAPRARSNSYGEYKGFTAGACFGKKGEDDGDGAWKHVFDLPDIFSRADADKVDAVGWDVLDMMGQSISPTDEGDLIVGAPIARPDCKQTVDVFYPGDFRTGAHTLLISKGRPMWGVQLVTCSRRRKCSRVATRSK